MFTTEGVFGLVADKTLGPFKHDFLMNTALENNVKVPKIFNAFFLPLHAEAVWYLENDQLRAGESSGALMTVVLHVLPVDDGWCGAV